MSEFLFSILLVLIMLGVGFPGCSWLGRSSKLTLTEQTLSGFLVGALLVGFSVWAVGSVTFSSSSMWPLVGVLGVTSLPGLWIWGRLLWQQDRSPFSFGKTGKNAKKEKKTQKLKKTNGVENEFPFLKEGKKSKKTKDKINP